MAETVLACEALHQLGYIHRDIKPSNFILDQRGHIKLADFGSNISISQLPSISTSRNMRLCISRMLLTVQGNSTYGIEVDCWSLGICLHEMLQEVPPFYSDISDNDTHRKILFHQNLISFNDAIPISDNASRLLAKREERLTLEQIKMHPFFYGVDWEHVFDEDTPPFCPITSVDNFSIFSDTTTNDQPRYYLHPLTSPLSPLLE